MRSFLATLLLVLPPAAHAADRYSGTYAADCGPLVCELRISPAGADRWRVRWTATDPTERSVRPVCAFETTAAIGEAAMGGAGVVTGIAVGTVRGKPFGIFDLGEGRVSWSSTWRACESLSPKGIYEAYADE